MSHTLDVPVNFWPFSFRSAWHLLLWDDGADRGQGSSLPECCDVELCQRRYWKDPGGGKSFPSYRLCRQGSLHQPKTPDSSPPAAFPKPLQGLAISPSTHPCPRRQLSGPSRFQHHTASPWTCPISHEPRLHPIDRCRPGSKASPPPHCVFLFGWAWLSTRGSQ